MRTENEKQRDWIIHRNSIKFAGEKIVRTNDDSPLQRTDNACVVSAQQFNVLTNQSKSAIMKKISLFFAQQKIEEMTLYILQLEERVQQLENGKGGTR